MAIVISPRQPWQMFREHRLMVLGLILLWNGFVLVEFLRRWYLNDYWGAPSDESLAVIPRLLYHYYPWIIISLGIGWLVHSRPLFVQASPPIRASHVIWHIVLAMLIAIFFGAWAALAYWVFSPELVTRVTFGYVFIEQYLKWLPLIVLVYAGIAGAWTLATFRKTGLDGASLSDQLQTILVSIGDKDVPVHVDQILWIEADDNYVHLHTAGRSYIHRETLKNLETQLAARGFYRSHRSALVNLTHVQSLDTQQVHFNEGKSAPLSRRNRSALKSRLDSLNFS